MRELDGIDEPRVLLVRLSAVGDVIHGLPVLHALCAEAERPVRCYWAVEERAAPLLKNHPLLDGLVVLPRRWLASWKGLRNARRELRALDCHLAVDLQGLAKSALAARLSGAPRRVGFAPPDGREGGHWLMTRTVRPAAAHVVDRNRELIAGDRPLPPVSFPLPAWEKPAVDEWIGGEGLDGGFAVVNPGAGWPSKRWPPARYGAVAARLREAYGLPTVAAWGGEAERLLAETIVTASGGAARMAPPTDLPALGCLLRRARICIGSDTGPLHLAAALDVPCVGLYGPMPAERNGPYGRRHVAIQKMRVEGSSRQRRGAGPEAMEAIGVDDVLEACGRILSGSGE